jgi:hypothetical protein
VNVLRNNLLGGSLVQLAILDLSAVDNIFVLGCPVVSDEVSVSFDVDGKLSLLVVLELGVVEHLLGDDLASVKPDSFDVERGLLSNDGVHGKDVSSEVVASLEESVEVVCGLVENDSLAFALLVLDVEDDISISIVVVEEELEAFFLLLLLGEVDEVGLESVEVELGGGEDIEGVNFLLFDGFSGFCLDDFLLSFNGLGLKDGLEGLLGEFDVSKSVNNFWEFADSFHPCGGVSHSFSESSVEDGLEGEDQGDCDGNVSNGKGGSNEVVLASELGVEDLDGFLDGFNGIIVLSL